MSERRGGAHVAESNGGFFKSAAEFVKMGKCSIVSSLLPQRRIGDEAPEVRNRKDHEWIKRQSGHVATIHWLHSGYFKLSNLLKNSRVKAIFSLRISRRWRCIGRILISRVTLLVATGNWTAVVSSTGQCFTALFTGYWLTAVFIFWTERPKRSRNCRPILPTTDN